MVRSFAKENGPSAAELDAMQNLIGGKWITPFKLDKDSKHLVGLTNSTATVEGFLNLSRPVKAPKSVVDRVSVIGLRADGTTLWVDVRNARPVRVQPTAGESNVRTFTEFDQVAIPKAPPATEVVDGKTIGL